MKSNMACWCFLHFCKDKVSMAFAFFAIAFNIKKMCSKIEKQVKNGGNTPCFRLFLHKSRSLQVDNLLFGEIYKSRLPEKHLDVRTQERGCAVKILLRHSLVRIFKLGSPMTLFKLCFLGLLYCCILTSNILRLEHLCFSVLPSTLSYVGLRNKSEIVWAQWVFNTYDDAIFLLSCF